EKTTLLGEWNWCLNSHDTRLRLEVRPHLCNPSPFGEAENAATWEKMTLLGAWNCCLNSHDTRLRLE
ncbi:19944_t:CDS:2, partial [Racocetra fulgida]